MGSSLKKKQEEGETCAVRLIYKWVYVQPSGGGRNPLRWRVSMCPSDLADHSRARLASTPPPTGGVGRGRPLFARPSRTRGGVVAGAPFYHLARAAGRQVTPRARADEDAQAQLRWHGRASVLLVLYNSVSFSWTRRCSSTLGQSLS